MCVPFRRLGQRGVAIGCEQHHLDFVVQTQGLFGLRGFHGFREGRPSQPGPVHVHYFRNVVHAFPAPSERLVRPDDRIHKIRVVPYGRLAHRVQDLVQQFRPVFFRAGNLVVATGVFQSERIVDTGTGDDRSNDVVFGPHPVRLFPVEFFDGEVHLVERRSLFVVPPHQQSCVVETKHPLDLPVLGHRPSLRIDTDVRGAIIDDGSQDSQPIVDPGGRHRQHCQQAEFFGRVALRCCVPVEIDEFLPVFYLRQVASYGCIGGSASGVSVQDLEDLYGVAPPPTGHHHRQTRHDGFPPPNKVVLGVFLKDRFEHLGRPGQVTGPPERQNRFRSHRIAVAPHDVVDVRSGFRRLAVTQDGIFHPLEQVQREFGLVGIRARVHGSCQDFFQAFALSLGRNTVPAVVVVAAAAAALGFRPGTDVSNQLDCVCQLVYVQRGTRPWISESRSSVSFLVQRSVSVHHRRRNRRRSGFVETSGSLPLSRRWYPEHRFVEPHRVFVAPEPAERDHASGQYLVCYHRACRTRFGEHPPDVALGGAITVAAVGSAPRRQPLGPEQTETKQRQTEIRRGVAGSHDGSQTRTRIGEGDPRLATTAATVRAIGTNGSIPLGDCEPRTGDDPGGHPVLVVVGGSVPGSGFPSLFDHRLQHEQGTKHVLVPLADFRHTEQGLPADRDVFFPALPKELQCYARVAGAVGVIAAVTAANTAGPRRGRRRERRGPTENLHRQVAAERVRRLVVPWSAATPETRRRRSRQQHAFLRKDLQARLVVSAQAAGPNHGRHQGCSVPTGQERRAPVAVEFLPVPGVAQGVPGGQDVGRLVQRRDHSEPLDGVHNLFGNHRGSASVVVVVVCCCCCCF
mmetsp:Transcript_111399/g.228106  ORF Transcript_111399/g.228106 Transcript_111399/m.228106 type:complete len:853 (-) Transcript_111399:40-2598(-)